MADTKISDMTDLTTLASGDEIPVADASDLAVNKSFTLATLTTYLQAALGMPRVKRLSSQHSISSTTGTEVTDLTIALEAGTYVFEYYIICRSATTTVGPMFGVNFDGTAAVKTMSLQFPDGSIALTAYTANMDDEGVKGLGVISGMATKTYTTTAPNLGTTVGVTTTAADIPAYIRGVLIVTVAGNLELWHSSETATATSVEVGTSLVVTRTA
jgi:hypothetical protein